LQLWFRPLMMNFLKCGYYNRFHKHDYNDEEGAVD